MQIHIADRSAVETQAALAAGRSKAYVHIEGRPDELDDPGNLIRAAAREITVGKACGRRASKTATKASALLLAASLRAKSLDRWGTSPEYDPRADLLKLDFLARTKLGPCRSQSHPVTQFRAGLADTIRILGEPGS